MKQLYNQDNDMSLESSGKPISRAIKSLQLRIPPAIEEATKILRDLLSDSSTKNNNNNKDDKPQRVTRSNSKPQRVETETETKPQRVPVSEDSNLADLLFRLQPFL